MGILSRLLEDKPEPKIHRSKTPGQHLGPRCFHEHRRLGILEKLRWGKRSIATASDRLPLVTPF
ncbi:MAG: hypothetical protein EA381_14070 [Planctomycetaceae bacterium]|nr:MAG: hypothetical protein EA381_14070 [Planctomycetaceae bacterium]